MLEEDENNANNRIPQFESPQTEEMYEIDRSVTPGSPRLEHALFVILGAVATVAVFLDGLGLL